MASAVPPQPTGGDRRFRETVCSTLPAEAFDASAMLAYGDLKATPQTARLDAGDAGDAAAPPQLMRASLDERLAGTVSGPGRYVVERLLGSGSSGNVFAARDRDCARDIAVKVLHESTVADQGRLSRFVQEAQVAARLEHPGILPVYDIDLASDGNVYFTMRRIDGMSLCQCMERAQAGEVPAAIAGVGERVGIALRVAEAVAFAHHRGVIHQDIKPANIMLGGFGEVVLVDWGTATWSGAPQGTGGLVGTPLYMAPEQARRQPSDERSDVYCLGATLYHLLFLRPPTWDEDAELFWLMKRHGDVAAPTAAERARVSPRLVDILLKALAADPAQRYRSAHDLAQDLKAWQEGRAISARPDSVFDRLGRFARRNRPVIATAAIALVALAVVGGLLWREKARESTAWALVASEDFAGDSAAAIAPWSAWLLPNYAYAIAVDFARSPWRIQDGALHGDGSRATVTNLAWGTGLVGDLRVEWTLTPVTDSLNLNCFISGSTRLDAYVFHIGGWNMPNIITLTKGRALEILERQTIARPLLPGTSHRVVMEREGDAVRIAIDGTVIIDFRDIEALVGPEHDTFGFEVAFSSLIIDDVRISTKPLPLRASPLAIADALFDEGLFARARARYEEFLLRTPDAVDAAMARYRIARCLAGEKSFAQALTAFADCRAAHPQGPVADAALARRAALLLELRREDDARAEHAQLARPGAHVEARAAALFDYSEWLRGDRRLIGPDLGDPSLTARVADVRRRILDLAASLGLPVVGNSTLGACADILNSLGRHEEVLAEYPEQESRCGDALNMLGRCDEVLWRYPHLLAQVRSALWRTRRYAELGGMGDYEGLLHLGRAAELLERPQRDARAWGLLGLGRYDEVLRDYPEQRLVCAKALERQGRWQEMLDGYGDIRWLGWTALEGLGRWRELRSDTDAQCMQVAGFAEGFAHLAEGDSAAGLESIAWADAQPFPWLESEGLHLVRYVLAPMARWRSGFGAAPSADWRRWRDEQRHRLGDMPTRRFDFLLGDSDQPPHDPRTELEAELLVGIRAELAGSSSEADAAYARYRAGRPDLQKAVCLEFLRIPRR